MREENQQNEVGEYRDEGENERKRAKCAGKHQNEDEKIEMRWKTTKNEVKTNRNTGMRTENSVMRRKSTRMRGETTGMKQNE